MVSGAIVIINWRVDSLPAICQYIEGNAWLWLPLKIHLFDEDTVKCESELSHCQGWDGYPSRFYLWSTGCASLQLAHLALRTCQQRSVAEDWWKSGTGPHKSLTIISSARRSHTNQVSVARGDEVLSLMVISDGCRCWTLEVPSQ